MKWQPIETAPKDGSKFLALEEGYEYPEVIFWQEYDEDDREELGSDGYWCFAVDLIGDVAGECNPILWAHYPPLPAPEAAP